LYKEKNYAHTHRVFFICREGVVERQLSLIGKDEYSYMKKERVGIPVKSIKRYQKPQRIENRT